MHEGLPPRPLTTREDGGGLIADGRDGGGRGDDGDGAVGSIFREVFDFLSSNDDDAPPRRNAAAGTERERYDR